jgi:hypothetical protein
MCAPSRFLFFQRYPEDEHIFLLNLSSTAGFGRQDTTVPFTKKRVVITISAILNSQFFQVASRAITGSVLGISSPRNSNS